MFQFKLFPRVENYTCDNCRGRFYQETAYSAAHDWEEFDRFPTFCFNCAAIIEKRENRPQKLDKRTLNKTGRTHQLGTRVKKDFLKKLKAIAHQESLKYVEVLERALDYYAERLKKNKAT